MDCEESTRTIIRYHHKLQPVHPPHPPKKSKMSKFVLEDLKKQVISTLRWSPHWLFSRFHSLLICMNNLPSALDEVFFEWHDVHSLRAFQSGRGCPFIEGSECPWYDCVGIVFRETNNSFARPCNKFYLNCMTNWLQIKLNILWHTSTPGTENMRFARIVEYDSLIF